MTISGDKKNLGKVLYASKCFLKFTEIPTDLVKTFFFSNFIPRSYSKDHDQLLAHFTKNYTESVIYKSLPLFLVNYYGYLCEFFVSLECVGDKDSINFLCSIEPINSENRELAVIDLSGYIYSHSKHFLNVFGYDQQNAENMNIQYYIHEIIISELIIDSTYEIEYMLPKNTDKQVNKTIGLILKCSKIAEITIYTLFITDNMNELNNWKLKKDFYANQEYKCIMSEEIEEEQKVNENKAAKKNLLQLPDENILNTDKMKIFDKVSQLKLDAQSSTLNTLDQHELKAVEQSKRVLKVTTILLFLSVLYI